MNLLQMPWVIAWTWSFLTSEVVAAVKGQKHHILMHTLASRSTSSAYQRFKKWDQLWLSASIFRILSLVSSSEIISNHYREWVTFEDHPLTRSKLNCTTPMMFVTSLGDNPKKEKKNQCRTPTTLFSEIMEIRWKVFFCLRIHLTGKKRCFWIFERRKR